MALFVAHPPSYSMGIMALTPGA